MGPCDACLRHENVCEITRIRSVNDVMAARNIEHVGRLCDAGKLAAQVPHQLLAGGDAGVCVMHIKGVPKKFPSDWHYRNVMGDLIRFLEKRTGMALQAGIAPERICVDPGIEFGKLVGHDMAALQKRITASRDYIVEQAGWKKNKVDGVVTGASAK